MKEHVEKLKQKSMQIRLGRYQNRKAHKQDRDGTQSATKLY